MNLSDSRPVVEALENRCLLSVAPIGQIDLGPIGFNGDGEGQRLDSDGQGNLVYAWNDEARHKVFAQTYAPDGTPSAQPPILIGERPGTFINNPGHVRVDVGVNGQYVVTWSNDQTKVLYARVFSGMNDRVGKVVEVASTKNGNVVTEGPAVAPDGGFVVPYHLAQNGADVYAQRFDAAGRKVGKAIAVATGRDDDSFPRASMDVVGNFVIAWQGRDQEYGVYAQRYSASGAALGSRIHVNTTIEGGQTPHDLAVAPDGRFVVTWRSPDPTPDVNGISVFMQLFNAAGARIGGETRVNQTFIGNQWQAHNTFTDNGGFAVSWISDGQGEQNVMAREFDGAGAPLGPEFKAWNDPVYEMAGVTQIASQPGGFAVGWSGIEVVRPDPGNPSTWYGVQSETYRATRYSFGTSGGFSGLGDLAGGQVWSNGTAVTNDGVVIGGSVGTAGSTAFRWTATGGMVALGDLAGGSHYSHPHDITADGSVVIGQSNGVDGQIQPFRWTQATGMVVLGNQPGTRGQAFGMSADGSVVVGISADAAPGGAFRWTAAGGMESLGTFDGFQATVAEDVSDDGEVIVGWGQDRATGANTEAFRWTAAGGMVGLGFLPGYEVESYATAISADGSTVLGFSSSSTAVRSFVWTEAAGMVALSEGFRASHLSADGSVLVGSISENNDNVAAVWDAQNGVRTIRQLLTAAGVAAAGWNIQHANGISPDGQIIVGDGMNPGGYREGWVVRLEGSTGSSWRGDGWSGIPPHYASASGFQSLFSDSVISAEADDHDLACE